MNGFPGISDEGQTSQACREVTRGAMNRLDEYLVGLGIEPSTVRDVIVIELRTFEALRILEALGGSACA